MNPQDTKNTKQQTICNLILQLLPNWKNTPIHHIKLQRMLGITNQTYKVSREGDPQALIYRQFGDASDNVFLDRETEQLVYKFISESKSGPQVYAIGNNVRIEQFINSKVLKTSQMLTRSYVEDIAYSLYQFHQLDPHPEITKKQSLFQLVFFKKAQQILTKCHNKMNKPIFTEKQQHILQYLSNWISAQQISFMKQASKPLQNAKIVFSHNDLLPGNILIRQSDNKSIFIDYEYSCFNYQIYDIANYFNQCVYDYNVKQSPYFKVLKLSKQQETMKQYFIYCYCMCSGRKYIKYKQEIKYNVELSVQNKIIYDRLKLHLMVGQMLSNIMWGYWAIIVSKNPQIEFDYISFAQCRYQMYMNLKQKYMGSK